jgi:protein-S-isoprenylcysteine O-methyltransferase Ste14
LHLPEGWSVSRFFTDLAVHLAALGIGAVVAFVPDQGPAALAYFLAARLAYVLYTSFELRAQSMRLGLESRQVAEARHETFHRLVLRLQNIDGIAFVSLCVATRSTLPFDEWEPAFLAAGIALIILGVGTKTWAVRSLGANSYTWHDFFVPKEKFEPCRTGPYRFLKDPMYTLGYLHTYGLALICDSWYGLAASLFAHASILIVNEVVEKPHFRRLCNAVVEPAKSP